MSLIETTYWSKTEERQVHDHQHHGEEKPVHVIVSNHSHKGRPRVCPLDEAREAELLQLDA